MSILRCYLHNATIENVVDIRCENKRKCTGCIFVETLDRDMVINVLESNDDTWDYEDMEDEELIALISNRKE